MSELLLDCAGRRRSPVTMPGFHVGHAPGNKAPALPGRSAEGGGVIAVMRVAGDNPHGRRLRGLIVILWRSGLRIQKALILTEADLDQSRGAVLVRRGKGGRRREVGTDALGLGTTAAVSSTSAGATGCCPAKTLPTAEGGRLRAGRERLLAPSDIPGSSGHLRGR